MSIHDDIGLKVRRAQDALAQIRGTARSGGVEVVVDANMHLTGLHLTEAVLAHSPDQVAALITNTYRDAAADAEPQVRAATAELVDDPSVTRARTQIDTAASTPPTQAEAADEIGWMQQHGSILRPANEPRHRPR